RRTPGLGITHASKLRSFLKPRTYQKRWKNCWLTDRYRSELKRDSLSKQRFHPANRRFDVAGRVVDVRAQAQAAGRGSADAVLLVQVLRERAHLRPIEALHSRDHDSAAALGLHWRDDLHAINLRQALFQHLRQFSSARLDIGESQHAM